MPNLGLAEVSHTHAMCLGPTNTCNKHTLSQQGSILYILYIYSLFNDAVSTSNIQRRARLQFFVQHYSRLSNGHALARVTFSVMSDEIRLHLFQSNLKIMPPVLQNCFVL
jgi:triacylglycerol esterase/lipase EstA (alpha/beta hydrolase family)